MKFEKAQRMTLVGLAAATLTLWAAVPSAHSPVPAKSAPPAVTSPEPAPDPVIPAGTNLTIRLDNSLGTATSRPGDHFTGTLASPVIENGTTLLPTGTPVGGYVVASAPSGRLKGRAVLTLRLTTVSLSGETLHVSTRTDTRASTGHKKRNLAWIGGGGGGGLLIGALAGGPVGALVGAGSGAAAGFTGAVITGRKQVKLPAETKLTFHLSKAVTLPQSA